MQAAETSLDGGVYDAAAYSAGEGEFQSTEVRSFCSYVYFYNKILFSMILL
jgi:hypothetical protein